MKSKELREQRAVIAKQMEQLVLQARKEDRPLNAEEQQQFDRMDNEQQELLQRAEGFERMERFDDLRLEQINSKTATKSMSNSLRRDDDHDRGIFGWLAHRSNNYNVAEELKASAERVGINYNSDNVRFDLRAVAPRSMAELRGTNPQSSLVAGLGAEFVPTTLANFIEVALLAYSNVRQYARVIRTPDGATFKIPTSDDTSNESTIIDQNSADAVKDIATDEEELASYMFTTGIIKIPVEWSRDSQFPVLSWVGEQLGVRHARGTNKKLTTGAGTTEPQGFVTGATAGKTLGHVSSVTYSEMLDAIYSVPAAYRDSPSFAIVGSDTFAKALRAQLDGQNRPLWEVSVQAGQPDRYAGKPFLVNYHMSAMGTTNAKVAVCGDFNQFLIRDVGQFTLATAKERYFEYRQVGLVGFGAMDSLVLNSNALKYIVTAASSSSG